MCLNPIPIVTRPKVGEPQAVTVSCGKCLQCLQAQSREWSFRIMDEASQYKNNCFLTLTYDDEHLPDDSSVSRLAVQLFMKRLRKRLPFRIRFFACGEYGERFGRPHYHIIVFNWFPDDAYEWRLDSRKELLYRSPLLESVWPFGFSSCGKLTYESARYCAKYMSKFYFNGFTHGRTTPVTRPFVQMSTRPGIGFNSVYNCDISADRIYRNGMESKIPRYYLKVMERDGIYLDECKSLRKERGEARARSIDLHAMRKRYDEIFLKKRYVVKGHF